jgi:hypothetical protein
MRQFLLAIVTKPEHDIAALPTAQAFWQKTWIKMAAGWCGTV